MYNTCNLVINCNIFICITPSGENKYLRIINPYFSCYASALTKLGFCSERTNVNIAYINILHHYLPHSRLKCVLIYLFTDIYIAHFHRQVLKYALHGITWRDRRAHWPAICVRNRITPWHGMLVTCSFTINTPISCRVNSIDTDLFKRSHIISIT